VVVDVGNGKYGGHDREAQADHVFPINSGHEIYPYSRRPPGSTYLLIGDEEMSRRGRVLGGDQLPQSPMCDAGGVAQSSGGYTTSSTSPTR
jgi:hypothetical protein